MRQIDPLRDFPGWNLLVTQACHLRTQMSEMCQRLYKETRSDFLTALSPRELALYSEATKLPYAQEDWWRDIHDIVVVLAMKRICETKEGADKRVPSWLPEAAILHDRGYALLSLLAENGDAKEYHKRGGAHWEGADVRIAHSRLSQTLAQYLLGASVSVTGRSDEMSSITQILRSSGVQSVGFSTLPEATAEFFTVIEQHDYPLIGRYKEISSATQHHFDADSLYSISVTSFIKDFLFYVSDEEFLSRWARDVTTQPFEILDLLTLRLSRFYPSLEMAARVVEVEKVSPRGSSSVPFSHDKAISPHSQVARDLTDAAFRRLASLCGAIKDATQVDSMLEIIESFARNELQAYRA